MNSHYVFHANMSNATTLQARKLQQQPPSPATQSATKAAGSQKPSAFNVRYANASLAGKVPQSAPGKTSLARQQNNLSKEQLSPFQDEALLAMDAAYSLAAGYQRMADGDAKKLEAHLKWDLKAKVAEAYRYRTMIAQREGQRKAASLIEGGSSSSIDPSTTVERQKQVRMEARQKQRKRVMVMKRLVQDVDVVFHPKNAPQDGSGPLAVYEGTKLQFNAMMLWDAPKV